MSIPDFFKKNFPMLGFGLLLTFFSGYGQTFLLSLYVPSIEQYFAISNTAFGSLYAAATLASAFTLPWLGSWFDRVNIRHYSLMVVAGLAISLFLLSSARHILAVLPAFYGLRLFGQGLMSHTAVSAMARYFNAGRGKAIGMATLGHPAGEAILPILVTLLIGAAGWQCALQISALSCIVLVAPLALYLLRKSALRIRAYAIQVQGASSTAPGGSPLHLLRDRHFWLLAPLVFMHGFSLTVVFFFQLKLGAARGWSPEWIAGSISAFALASAFGMTAAGPLVDRLSARRIFPLHAIPYLLGLGVLVFCDQPMAYPVALLFLGLSNGLGSTIHSAMMAEIYGVGVIGRVRSIFATVIVVSTGVGPIVFGIMLDAGWSFSRAFTMVSAAMALAVANGIRGLRRGGGVL